MRHFEQNESRELTLMPVETGFAASRAERKEEVNPMNPTCLKPRPLSAQHRKDPFPGPLPRGPWERVNIRGLTSLARRRLAGRCGPGREKFSRMRLTGYQSSLAKTLPDPFCPYLWGGGWRKTPDGSRQKRCGGKGLGREGAEVLHHGNFRTLLPTARGSIILSTNTSNSSLTE